MIEQQQKYLIHIQFGDPNLDNILESSTLILKTVRELSDGENILAYTSKDAGTLGMIAAIGKPAAVIRSIIDGSTSPPSDTTGPPSVNELDDTGFRSGDSIFVMKLGNDFSSKGFNKPETWLKNH